MIEPRAHVRALAPVHHGSIGDAELARVGLRRDEVVDFSVNSNPLGPSPAAVEAVRAAAWTYYPDDRAEALRDELARRAGVVPSQVVVANGSAELIWLLALAYVDPGQSAVVVGPTFGEYARAVRVAGGVVHEHRARAEEDFAVDVDAVSRLARRVGARLVFVCNPNNPTGVLLRTVPECERLVAACAAVGVGLRAETTRA
jgi:histidinol-phosphate/aromatic aminotransferase/cobyric acid decarboxylase-like protein